MNRAAPSTDHLCGGAEGTGVGLGDGAGVEVADGVGDALGAAADGNAVGVGEAAAPSLLALATVTLSNESFL
jgi:hypothetical protein